MCDNMYCVQGDNGCAADSHYAFETWMGTRNGTAHSHCVQATCDDRHEQCVDAEVPEAEELGVLEHAATAGDRAKVESILDEYSSLTVNVDRSALQQVNCSGNVVAHIPVPSALITALAAESQR
jgi:hypothetical protein